MNLIPMNELYVGEIAEIAFVDKKTNGIKKLYDMGIREGKIVDMMYSDHIVSKKVIVGVDNTRITFNSLLTNSIKVRPLKSSKPLKILMGMLPICANCKQIRDDNGQWRLIEEYIHENSEADFSHGICPCCVKTLYPSINPNKI